MSSGGSDLAAVGTAAVALGVVSVAVGTALLVLAGLTDGGGDVEAGGVIFVGPIPVVFGTGRAAAWLAVAIALLMVAFYAVVLR